jgi:hypothetical protein
MGFYFSPQSNILVSGNGGSTIPVTTGLQFHFDSTDITTLFIDAGITNPINGQPIQEWHSPVGNYILRQPVVASRPTYTQNNPLGLLNGASHLNFDGSLDFMEMGYDPTLLTNDTSYFLVCRPNNNFVSGDAFFQLGGNGNGRGNAFYQFLGDNEYSHGDWLSYYVNTTYLANVDTSHIITATVGGTPSGLTLRTNGSSNTANAPISISYFNQPTWLGRDYFGGDEFGGAIAEWGKFDRQLTPTEVTSLMAYFNTKYGTPI